VPHVPAHASRGRFSAPGILGALGVLALSLSACLFDGADSPRRAILPLATGNTWSYVDSTFHGTDSVTLDSTRVSITGTRRVTLAGGLRTVHLWNVHDQATSLPGALNLWLQNRADGNHTVGAQQDTASFAFEALHVKYPATAGERYPIYFLFFRAGGSDDGASLIPVIDTLEAEVVSIAETCITPAGTFACVHYRGWRPGNVLHADSWYAPGIGWLGSETVREDVVNSQTRTVRTRRVLKAFSLKQQN
jgi:hypothetical protein